jgi:hypothetical protein
MPYRVNRLPLGDCVSVPPQYYGFFLAGKYFFSIEATTT